VSLAIGDLVDAAVSHALTLGVFEAVNAHEPKSSPNSGVTAAVWVDTIAPIKSSGLDSTSLRVALSVRIYTNMLSDPQDAIDTGIVTALDALMAEYSGDFTFDGLVREIDLLGAYGDGLGAVAGYLNLDNKMYRVMTVTVPLIVNDVWTQEAT
jgi:hypothetical protein